jgi:hypothetical protein
VPRSTGYSCSVIPIVRIRKAANADFVTALGHPLEVPEHLAAPGDHRRTAAKSPRTSTMSATLFAICEPVPGRWHAPSSVRVRRWRRRRPSPRSGPPPVAFRRPLLPSRDTSDHRRLGDSRRAHPHPPEARPSAAVRRRMPASAAAATVIRASPEITWLHASREVFDRLRASVSVARSGRPAERRSPSEPPGSDSSRRRSRRVSTRLPDGDNAGRLPVSRPLVSPQRTAPAPRITRPTIRTALQRRRDETALGRNWLSRARTVPVA